jgi:C_GCAxxG_C_C family probable redox protein
MERSAIAADNMAVRGMNCAQSVLEVYCQELGLDRNQALRIALGFGGGMSYTGGVCGAVTGAYMVIGLKMNLQSDNLASCKEKAYALVSEFTLKFRQRHQSVLCGDLLGYDLRQPEQINAARAAGLFKTKCPNFVREAVEILEELVFE